MVINEWRRHYSSSLTRRRIVLNRQTGKGERHTEGAIITSSIVYPAETGIRAYTATSLTVVRQ